MHAPTPEPRKVDPLEVLKAQAEYGGALRELESLQDALRGADDRDGHLQRMAAEAKERVAKAAARLAALRMGRA